MMSVVLESPVSPPQRRSAELPAAPVEAAQRLQMPGVFCVACLAALCAAAFGVGYLLSVFFTGKGE